MRAKQKERQRENTRKRETDDAITLALDRVMSWPVLCISVGRCVKLQSNYTSLQRLGPKSRQQSGMRHGNTNCDAPTQPSVLCSRSKPILYTHTQVANLDILQTKSTLIWSGRFLDQGLTTPAHFVFFHNNYHLRIAILLGLVIWFCNIPGTANMSCSLQTPFALWIFFCPSMWSVWSRRMRLMKAILF